MFNLIFSKDFDYIIYEISKLEKIDYINILEKKFLKKQKIENINDLNNFIANIDNNLFNDSIEKFYILEFINKDLFSEKELIQKIFLLDKISLNNLYFIFNDITIFKLAKKILEKNKIQFNILEIKGINSKEAKNLLTNYLEIKKIKLDERYKNLLLTNINNYRQIVNIVDIASLIKLPQFYLKKILIIEKKPVFWLNLNPDNPESYKHWLNYLNSDDVQLLISLMYKKIENTNSKNKNYFLKLLIKTDQLIKTTDIDPIIALKLFLYQIKIKNPFLLYI